MTGRGALRYQDFMIPSGVLADAERREMAMHGPTDAQILRQAGAQSKWGEQGFTLYERTTIRPALTINGIMGDIKGRGVKGLSRQAPVPSSASGLARTKSPQ